MSTSNGVEIICSTSVQHARMQTPTKVTAARGSVVDYTGTAIVNAANEGCLGGGGVDGAISDRGGDSLYEARTRLPQLKGRRGGFIRCPTGESKTTHAGELPCEYVIHSVGPNYRMYEEEAADALLYSAYRSAMVEAKRHRMPDVAFCLLSAGIFRGRKSLYDVLAIGALAVSACVYDGLEEVFLVGFTPAEVETLQTLIEELLTAETREAAQAKLFERLAPAVKQMHIDCTAGILEPNLEVGYAVAMQAAAAGGEPIQAGPITPGDELMVEGKAVGIS